MDRVDVPGANPPGLARSSVAATSRRPGPIALVAALVMGLVMSGISCATASAAGIEHDQHVATSHQAFGESAEFVPTSSAVGPTSSSHATHRRHVEAGDADDQPGRSDSNQLPSPEPTIVVGVDMICAAVTEVRQADPIVSLIVLPVWFVDDVNPASCVLRPDPPVPKIS